MAGMEAVVAAARAGVAFVAVVAVVVPIGMRTLTSATAIASPAGAAGVAFAGMLQACFAATGVGAFFALEFVSDRAKRTPLIPWQGKSQGVMPALFGGLRKRGVYAFGRYNIVHIAPPLVIEETELDEALAVLDEAIGDMENAYAASVK